MSVLKIKLKKTAVNRAIVQIYTKTTAAEKEEIEQFYNLLELTINHEIEYYNTVINN